jgi:hypothetical protein
MRPGRCTVVSVQREYTSRARTVSNLVARACTVIVERACNAIAQRAQPLFYRAARRVREGRSRCKRALIDDPGAARVPGMSSGR